MEHWGKLWLLSTESVTSCMWIWFRKGVFSDAASPTHPKQQAWHHIFLIKQDPARCEVVSIMRIIFAGTVYYIMLQAHSTSCDISPKANKVSTLMKLILYTRRAPAPPSLSLSHTHTHTHTHTHHIYCPLSLVGILITSNTL